MDFTTKTTTINNSAQSSTTRIVTTTSNSASINTTQSSTTYIAADTTNNNISSETTSVPATILPQITNSTQQSDATRSALQPQVTPQTQSKQQVAIITSLSALVLLITITAAALLYRKRVHQYKMSTTTPVGNNISSMNPLTDNQSRGLPPIPLPTVENDDDIYYSVVNEDGHYYSQPLDVQSETNRDLDTSMSADTADCVICESASVIGGDTEFNGYVLDAECDE